ncbi:MAG: hypothetical protein ACTTIC_00100 [Helicobacteraceae bacterium]
MSANPIVLNTIEMTCKICGKSSVVYDSSGFVRHSCFEVGFFMDPDAIKVYGVCSCCKQKEKKESL